MGCGPSRGPAAAVAPGTDDGADDDKHEPQQGVKNKVPAAVSVRSVKSFLQNSPNGGIGNGGNNSGAGAFRFYAIRDKYETLEEVTEGLRAAGLESSNLIVALDYTKSNTWTGKHSFGGKNLHHIDPEGRVPNEYQRCISVIGQTLASYDDDGLIPTFGFGDATTTDRSVFPFFPDRPARGFEEVLARYRELTPRVVLGGPTNFAPAIEAAIQIVEQTKAYHILLIIADGQVTNRAHTDAALVRASHYPLSIIICGVGDGPWEEMAKLDDELPSRAFDNVQFVNATAIFAKWPSNPEVAFAVAALMEVPEQYLSIRKLGLI
jgi:E3 ubiquitin-protein ligase RGLG